MLQVKINSSLVVRMHLALPMAILESQFKITSRNVIWISSWIPRESKVGKKISNESISGNIEYVCCNCHNQMETADIMVEIR